MRRGEVNSKIMSPNITRNHHHLVTDLVRELSGGMAPQQQASPNVPGLNQRQSRRRTNTGASQASESSLRGMVSKMRGVSGFRSAARGRGRGGGGEAERVSALSAEVERLRSELRLRQGGE